MRTRLLAALLVLFVPAYSFAHEGNAHSLPPWQAATDWPDRIVTTFNGDPATSFAVTWRTDNSVGRTIAQIAKATPETRFDLLAETMRAKTESVDLEVMETPEGVRHSLENVGMGTTHYHSVTFTDLEPNTLYAWRVQGDRGNWSEWIQTRTAKQQGPISFVYFGDSQNGVRPNWSRVIRMANQAVPDAAFFLHAGDLVSKGDSDYNWAEWFEAGRFIHAQTPVIPVPGNHENMAVWPEGENGKRVRVRTPLWAPQFTLPVVKSLEPSLHENAYDVRYNQDLHVFVIDSARPQFADQAAWLDEALSTSDAKWKVVSMHHPYFAPAEFDRRKDDALRRKAFRPIIEKHHVDLVLTGHIHTYARFSEQQEPHAARATRGTRDDVKTVYVISASGAKNTDIFDQQTVSETVGDGAPDFRNVSLDRVAGNTPMFQVFRINGDSLRYEARTAIDSVYDRFTLTKNADGKKRLSEGAEAYGETRLFSNTGPYREWYDLR